MHGFKHFFPVPPINTLELAVRGIGVQEHMHPCVIDRPFGTRDHLLMLFYDPAYVGAGKNAGKKAVLRTGETLMIWTPGCAQYYGSADHPYNHTWIHCNGRFVRALLKSIRLPCNRPFRMADPAIMERYLLAIHFELTNHAKPDFVIVKNLLENCLREIARLIKVVPVAEPGCPSALLKVRHYIESEYDKTITLAQLASMAQMSVPQLCAKFKKHFKTSPVAYLIRQRMHQAVHYLQDKNLKISAVARQVGYSDLFYFSKLFKKHYGASPRLLRRLQAGKDHK